MPVPALFRVASDDGSRLASGTIESGPTALLAPETRLDDLLARTGLL